MGQRMVGLPTVRKTNLIMGEIKMKKFIAILAVLMLVPFTAFGLESLSEDVMDNVTGQAGVSIATDINISATIDTLAWGDSDGIDSNTADSQGWIGLTQFKMDNLRVRLDTAMLSNPSQIRLFTIDVATGTHGPAAAPVTGTYVHIGIGSQYITMDNMSANVRLGGDKTTLSTAGAGKTLGDFTITNLAMRFDGMQSYVDIYAHEGAGVTMDLNIVITSLTIAGLAWGDNDGLGTLEIYNTKAPGPEGNHFALQHGGDFTNAGYVGLKNMAITNLTVKGQVMIDVASIDSAAIGITGADAAAIAASYAARTPVVGLLAVYQMMLMTGYDGGTTGVIIRLNDMKIGMSTFDADVVLANNAQLTLSNGLNGQQNSTLGSIYMKDVNVTIDGWVGIFAH
jgi:hypothetical protein